MIEENALAGFLALEFYYGATWNTWTSPVREMNVDRGGKVDGIQVTVDGGVQTITLVNAGDPLVDPSLVPKVPARIRYVPTDETVWQGTILDIDTAYKIDKNTGKVATFVTVTVVDLAYFTGAINSLPGPSGPLYLSGRLFNLFTELTTWGSVDPPSLLDTSGRLLASDQARAASWLELMASALATEAGSWWVGRDNVARARIGLDPGTSLATFSDVRGAGIKEYTDISASYDTRNLINTVDVLQSRSVEVSAGVFEAEERTFTIEDTTSRDAFGRRATSLDLNLETGAIERQNLVPDAQPNALSLVRSISSATMSLQGPAGIPGFLPWGGSYWVRATATGSGDVGFAMALPAVGSAAIGQVPVTAGQQYTASGWFKPSVNNRNCFISIRWQDASDNTVGSDAQSSSSALSNASFTRLSVTGTAPAGAVKAYVRMVQTGATASGQYLEGGGGMVENAASLGSFFKADFTQEAVWSNPALPDAHEVTYDGAVNASISTMRDWTELLARAAEIEAGLPDTPEVVIRSIWWNAQEDPELAASLEIQSRILVTFRGTDQDSLIVGMRHEFRPTRWMIRLDLQKIG